MKGQKEQGAGGFQHWQAIAYFNKKVTATKAKTFFPAGVHIEATRSSAASDYVWKEDTRIADT